MPLCRHKQPAPCPWCLSQDYSFTGEKIAPGRQNVSVLIAGRWYTLEAGGPDVGNTGLYLWPCSVALARLLAQHDLAGLTVLELGPGLGLPGMVAAAAGAQVTFAEADKTVAARLGDNLARNGLTAQIFTGCWKTLAGKYDLIIGSEITYSKELVRAVGDVINKHAKGTYASMLTEADREPRFIAREMPYRGVTITSQIRRDSLADGRQFLFMLWQTPGEAPPSRPTPAAAANARTLDSIAAAIALAEAPQSSPDPVS